MSAARQLLVLMNHTPTDAQVADAQHSLGVAPDHWLEPPAELRDAWAQVDPEAYELPPVLVTALRAWLDTAAVGDVLLVQGDPGATMRAALDARERGLVPIYATTKRVVQPDVRADDGTVDKRSVFRHVRFREYPV